MVIANVNLKSRTENSTVSKATVAELYRYPVKGLTDERLNSVQLLDGNCFPFDRAWAIEAGNRKFDPENPAYFLKANFIMLMRDEKLAALEILFDEETHTLTVFRGGKQVARGNLGEKLGRQLLEQFFAAYAAVLRVLLPQQDILSATYQQMAFPDQPRIGPGH